MNISIDTNAGTLTQDKDGAPQRLDLYSDEAFKLLSHLWLKVGWNQKYPYCFSWFGRPIIQIPEDIVRTQEVIYRLKPTTIVETGVAHGGSLIFYASLLRAMGYGGKVIGVDIEIRPHNRKAIEAHEFAETITLIEGDSTSPEVMKRVHDLVAANRSGPVLVILDSCHTKAHVRSELDSYHTLVTPGSYIVATDGSMQWLHDVPRGQKDWTWNHPTAAAAEFVTAHPEFVIEEPNWPFNESSLKGNLTHWPGAWLRRLSDVPTTQSSQ